MQVRENDVLRETVEALRKQEPFRALPEVRVSALKVEPKEGFDVSFNLKSADSSITVFGEIKTAVSPKLLEQMAPWIKRVKSLREGVAFAVICPAMSPQSQEYCIKNGIDFLDLAGNISINIPGKFTLQRLGMRNKERTESAATPSMINVFSGRSSRVLRVLLEKPKSWTQSAIAREMEAETARVLGGFQNQQLTFAVSIGALSKVIATLEEQLWIRRQGSAILIPEPKRLLMDWAEKYKERYRWRLRSSFQSTNPFGETLSSINDGLKSLIKGIYAFTGAAGAREAPYIDIDKVDVFLSPNKDDAKLRQLRPGPLSYPKLRFIYPYDLGVFMYAKFDGSIPTVSNIQTYLDLYARGGRDLKQADYLLSNVIEPGWKEA
jgi:hypothetical protein